jgi:hypothetical protein
VTPEPHPLAQASPFFGFALRVLGAIGTANWAAYLRLLRGAPFLLASAAAIHLPNMRSAALKTLLATGDRVPDRASSTGRTTGVPLERFASALAFDSLDQAHAFAEAHGDLVSLRAGPGGEAWVLRGVNPATGLLRNWAVPKLLPRYLESWLAAKVPGGRPSDLVLNPCTPPDAATFASESVAAAAAAAAAAARRPQQQLPVPAAWAVAPKAPAAAPPFGAAAAPQQQAAAAAPQQRVSPQQAPPAGRSSSGLLSKVTTFIFGGGGGGAAATLAPVQQPVQQPPTAEPAALQPPQQSAPVLAFGVPAPSAPQQLQQQQQQQQQQAQQQAQQLQQAQQAQQMQQQAAAAAAAAQSAMAAAAAQQQQVAALQQQLEAERRQRQAAQAELEAARRRAAEDAARRAAEDAAAEAERQRESQNVSGAHGLHRGDPAQLCPPTPGAASDARARPGLGPSSSWRSAPLPFYPRRPFTPSREQLPPAPAQELKALAHYRRTLLRRWRRHAAACAATRAQQQRREAAALLECHPALGVARGGRRRRPGGALAAVSSSAVAAPLPPRRSAREYDLLAEQGSKRRRRAEEEDAALGDHTPLDLPSLLAGALPRALLALRAGPAPGSADGAGAPLARVCYKLLLSSGWGDAAAPLLAPPPFQRRRAGWLRHKLALGLNAALPGAAAAPLEPPPPMGAPGARLPLAGAQAGAVYVLPGCGSEVLTLLELQGAIAGRRVALGLEVIDASAAGLLAPTDAADGGGGGGVDKGAAAEEEAAAEGVFAGASGLLLLASGPSEREVPGLVRRLAALLERLPEGARVPVAVLTCSGGGGGVAWQTLGARGWAALR